MTADPRSEAERAKEAGIVIQFEGDRVHVGGDALVREVDALRSVPQPEWEHRTECPACHAELLVTPHMTMLVAASPAEPPSLPEQVVGELERIEQHMRGAGAAREGVDGPQPSGGDSHGPVLDVMPAPSAPTPTREERIASLLREVMDAHRDPNSSDYNGCETARSACAWCTEAASLLRAPALSRERCTWTENEDGYYDTECRRAFHTADGTATENGLRFCAYCGRALRVEAFVASPTTEDARG